MSNVFMTVLNMSITAAFVIVVLCVARLVLQKIRAPKWISYMLWAVAGFRLAVPFTFESMFSLLPFKSEPIPRDIAAQAIPRIDSEIILVDNAVSGSLPAAAPYYSANPLQFWLTAGSYLWLAGIAVMLLYAVVSYLRLIRRKDSVTTPFVYGFLRPKIHIPLGLIGEELRYVTLHEQTHIKRKDYLIKLCAFALLCIHWFNPLAWVAFVLMCADMEMSCDERVLRELGTGAKADYSQALLSLSANRRILNASPLAFGEGGLKERVKNVLSFKKRSRVIIIIAVALVVVLSAGFAVNRITGENTSKSEDWLGNLDGAEMTVEQMKQIAERFIVLDRNLTIRDDLSVYKGVNLSSNSKVYRMDYSVEGGEFSLNAHAGEDGIITRMTIDRLSDGAILEIEPSTYGSIEEFISGATAEVSPADEPQPSSDPPSPNIIAEDIWFYGDEINTAEHVVERFGEEYFGRMISLPQNDQRALVDYKFIGHFRTEQQGDWVLGGFNYAVKPYGDLNSSPWWAGNGEAGTGEYEGYIVKTNFVVLYHVIDDSWHCKGFGTGGYELKDYVGAPHPAVIVINELMNDGCTNISADEANDRFIETDGLTGIKSETVVVRAQYIDKNGQEQDMSYTFRKPETTGIWEHTDPVEWVIHLPFQIAPDASETAEPTSTTRTHPITGEVRVFYTDEPYSSAADAVYTYYNSTVFAGKVSALIACKVESDYITRDMLRDETVAFSVEMSDNPKSYPVRIIILTRETGGIWQVINEGY
jgi:beta-lactamase regulating signal transducer with metallopeptidase domain